MLPSPCEQGEREFGLYKICTESLFVTKMVTTTISYYCILQNTTYNKLYGTFLVDIVITCEVETAVVEKIRQLSFNTDVKLARVAHI